MLSNRNGKVDDLEMFVFVGNSYDFVERFISFVMSENQVYIFFVYKETQYFMNVRALSCLYLSFLFTVITLSCEM